MYQPTTIHLTASTSSSHPMMPALMGKSRCFSMPTSLAKPISFTLAACHRGAAIESLCASKGRFDSDPSRLSTYYHSAGSYNAVDSGGSLVYVLRITGAHEVPSAMHFSGRFGTNTQELMFSPGEGDESSHVRFDESGGMWRHGSADKWYLCGTTSGHPMTLLVWVDGDAPTPQDPVCQQVGVQRMWAK